VGFINWIRAQHGRNDRIGDLAIDIRAERGLCQHGGLRGVRTLKGLVDHMEKKHGAGDGALESAGLAWAEYASRGK